MSKLDELLEGFRSDKGWNTENRDGSHRFDKEIEWIGQMINEYAEYFKMPVDEVVEIMEKKRTYSWSNYYKKANFPDVSSFGELVGVYKTFEEFQEYAERHWKGFKCPSCGNIGGHAQECVHRIEKDGKCDWCSYGFFQSGTRVIILENGFETIPIFEPVPLD